jgi:hypothetical protein
LHTTTEAENEVKSGLLLNVIVGKGAAILELLAGEDQALLVRRNTLLVLNLGLDIVDGIARLNLQGDGLAGQSLDNYRIVSMGRWPTSVANQDNLQICIPPRRRSTR